MDILQGSPWFSPSWLWLQLSHYFPNYLTPCSWNKPSEFGPLHCLSSQTMNFSISSPATSLNEFDIFLADFFIQHLCLNLIHETSLLS